uniref:Mitochondrial import receptor subunit TOM70 n=1 Tax=Cacopsylla melanoneura TaxID=428564 RepID=A0A8D9BK60_9HEMI
MSNSSVDICGHPVPKWALIAGGVAVSTGVAYIGYKNLYPSDQTKSNSKTNSSTIKKGTQAPVISDEPKSAAEVIEDLKSKGNDFFKQKKFKEAIDFYTKGILLCPANEKKTLSALYQNRAAAHENLGNYDSVLEDTNSALEIVPNYVKAIARRAKAYEQKGQLDLALQDVTACCIFENFANQSTLMSADRVLKALGAQHAKEEMSKRSFFKPSKQFIKTYLKSFPNDPILQPDVLSNGLTNGAVEQIDLDLLAKGKRAFEQEDYLLAIKYCTEEIDSPSSSSHNKALAKLLRASMYIFTSQSTKAKEDLNNIIEDPAVDSKVKVNAHIKRAAIHLHASSDFEKAFEDLEAAEKVDPSVADSYYQRGQIFCLFGKYDEALDNFDKTLSFNPNFVIARAQRYFVLHKKIVPGDVQGMEKSVTEFRQFVNANENCSEACTLFAQVLVEQEDFEGAEEYFKRSIKVDPANASLYVHRAMLVLQARGNIDEAIKLIMKAIDIDKSCLFAYETLGTIEVQRGRLEEAVKCFDKALPLAKDEAELSHIYSLRDAAIAQMRVCERYNIKVPSM